MQNTVLSMSFPGYSLSVVKEPRLPETLPSIIASNIRRHISDSEDVLLAIVYSWAALVGKIAPQRYIWICSSSYGTVSDTSHGTHSGTVRCEVKQVGLLPGIVQTIYPSHLLLS